VHGRRTLDQTCSFPALIWGFNFFTPAPSRLGWSCYQQTYALSGWLLWVRTESNKGEGAATGELRGLASELAGVIASSS
jgi:hypothetical protein